MNGGFSVVGGNLVIYGDGAVTPNNGQQ